MVGELFQSCNMPEAPKQNFFKNLFIGAISTTVDREELCSYYLFSYLIKDAKILGLVVESLESIDFFFPENFYMF